VFGRRSQQLLDALERESTQAGVNIEFLNVNYLEDTPDISAEQARLREQTVVGYIVNLWWVEYQRPEILTGVIKQLCSNSMPVAILDQVGQFVLDPSVRSGRVKVFRCAARQAGRAVARMLLALGHTRVAYISHQHDYLWSIDRLQGVVDQYAKAGLERQVEAHLSVFPLGYYELVYAMSGLDRHTFERVIEGHANEQQLRDALDSEQSSKSPAVLSSGKLSVVELIRSNLRVLPDLAGEIPDRRFYDRVRDALFTAGSDMVNLELMTELFDKASRDSRTTAWIAATDGIALAALDYLRGKGVRVPRDVSVVGFDNAPGALDGRLTTYDFNLSNVARRLLRFLLEPRRSRRPVDRAPTEIDGFIIERDTVGKSRR
jgi:DNA-binding LacI/PurR family transcriptional regulator